MLKIGKTEPERRKVYGILCTIYSIFCKPKAAPKYSLFRKKKGVTTPNEWEHLVKSSNGSTLLIRSGLQSLTNYRNSPHLTAPSVHKPPHPLQCSWLEPLRLWEETRDLELLSSPGILSLASSANVLKTSIWEHRGMIPAHSTCFTTPTIVALAGCLSSLSFALNQAYPAGPSLMLSKCKNRRITKFQ